MKNKQPLIILGIETSCDETAGSILKFKNGKFKIILNLVSSQIPLHRRYGGIIPEIAARAHLKNMPLIIKRISQKINLKKIDLIAVTRGPGLIISLLVGVETAKTLSYLFKKPLMGINHLEGHLAANFIGGNSKFQISNSKSFPAVSLIVSGGHTELGLMEKMGRYKKIGQTRDDAAGECFDKIAKLLNLGYPGGPAIAERVRQWKSQTTNRKPQIHLPRPMINSHDFDFSFSGLKTAVLYLVKKSSFAKATEDKNKIKNQNFIKNICTEAQQAIIDVLIYKTIKAAKKYQAKTVFLSGGVAANLELRQQMEMTAKKIIPPVDFFVPARNLCTDNAAMVAAAGALKYSRLKPDQKAKLKNTWQTIKPDPNLSL